MTARKTPAIPSLRTNTNKSATETTHTVPNSCVMSIHIVLPLPLIALPTTMFADFANRLILIKIRYIPHDAIILLSLVKSDMICCGNARQTPSVMIPTTIHKPYAQTHTPLYLLRSLFPFASPVSVIVPFPIAPMMTTARTSTLNMME